MTALEIAPMPPPIGTVVVIDRLADPVIEAAGQHVSSAYCETFWLPVIGPTALWLLRHAAARTADGPYAVDVEVLGKSLGVGGAYSKSSPLHRTFDRLKRFECADGGWSTTWRLRTHLPQLPRRQLVRLPDVLQRQHADLLGGA